MVRMIDEDPAGRLLIMCSLIRSRWSWSGTTDRFSWSMYNKYGWTLLRLSEVIGVNGRWYWKGSSVLAARTMRLKRCWFGSMKPRKVFKKICSSTEYSCWQSSRIRRSKLVVGQASLYLLHLGETVSDWFKCENHERDDGSEDSLIKTLSSLSQRISRPGLSEQCGTLTGRSTNDSSVVERERVRREWENSYQLYRLL